MFKAIDLLTESAASPIKQAWDGLIRDIQKYVEHNRASNDSGVALVRGDIVYASDHGEVTAAIYDPMLVEFPVAVCAMDIPNGSSGVLRARPCPLRKWARRNSCRGDSYLPFGDRCWQGNECRPRQWNSNRYPGRRYRLQWRTRCGIQSLRSCLSRL